MSDPLVSTRLICVGSLRGHYRTPDLDCFSDDTIAEVVLTGFQGYPPDIDARVEVHIETIDSVVAWTDAIPFGEWEELMPTWLLLNVPSGGGVDMDVRDEVHSVKGALTLSGKPHAVRQASAAVTPSTGIGSELAERWRDDKRPVRTTEDFLIGAIDDVPVALAADYVYALQSLRRREFSRDTRHLIADVCEALSRRPTGDTTP